MQGISLKNENRHYIKSSSFVMALIFTILCGAAALSLGYFINYFAKGHFIQNTEAILDTEIRYIDAVGIPKQQTDRIYIPLNESSQRPEDISPDISRLVEGIIVFDHSKNNKRYAAKIHILNNNEKILIGTDITEISNDFKFMQSLGIASIIFITLVIFIAYMISFFVVNGTNKIARTAHEIINTGDLSRRVDMGSNWDDLGKMASALNILLERIQELMFGIRQVSDNIAHDLRTPLTRLRNKLEDLKDSPQKEELLNEADHLLDTFSALLRISRIQSEKQRRQFQDINLKELIEDVIDFYEPLAEEKSISLSHNLETIEFYGDRDLLFQAYANLLDNALKYTPENGDVSVTMKYNKQRKILVEISDSGIGISEEERNKIFDRFYRSEQSRNSPGTGLGLSLVHAVITLHDGVINVETTQPGLKIITTF